MSHLSDKKIVLGVTGSIAAYKAAQLTRLLVRAGAQVRVVMTGAAKEFITPLTLSTLSKNPVLSDFVRDQTGTWNNHVELGLWADAFVIAPASANTLAKMAHGLCDNLLLASYLSARCPVFVAPAMDLDMLAHPTTRLNEQLLGNHGVQLIKSGHGELASGLVGDGRMAEPEEIITALENFMGGEAQPLAGKTALVTAGPTFEAIDPVRFIGNHASGKMGFALAEALAAQGAAVTLVTGPTHLHTNHPGIHVKPVVSAEAMYAACAETFPATDIAILAAAVADFRPKTMATQKIKKGPAEAMTLELVKTRDIAATLGQQKRPGQVLIGFALETENETAHAIKKLEAKNFDLIVLNSLNDQGAGFGYDTNQISLIGQDHTVKKFDLKTKKEAATDIVHAILEMLH